MDERWMTCRACGDVGLRWSRRSELEWLFGFIIPLRPYRCNSCYARQWGVRRPVINVGTGGLLLVVVLVFVIVIREWIFLPSETEEQIVSQSEGPASARDGTPIESPSTRGAAVAPVVLPEKDEEPQPLLPAEESPAEMAPQPRVPSTNPQAVEEPAPRTASSALDTAGPEAGSGGGNIDQVLRAFLGVRAQRTSEGLALVILSSRPVMAYQRTTLENPRRWVFDLPGRWRKGTSSQIAVDYPGVEAVRVGYHSDKLRVVIDLSSPSIELTAVEKAPRGLEIHLRRAGDSAENPG